MAKVDTVYDFSPKALVEVKSWLEPWFLTRCPCASAAAPTLPFFDEVAALAATRDLLGYWRLGDGATPFLDTSAAASGPNNMVKTSTGTAMNDSVTGALPAGDDDGAVEFLAVSGAAGDYLTATDTTFSAAAGGFTAAVWVYPKGSYAGTQHIFTDNDGSDGGWAIGMNAARKVFFHRKDSGGNATATGSTLPSNQWTFVSIDWDPGAGVNIYLNGALVYTDAVVQGISATTTLYIGRGAVSGTPNSFQGVVDEASYWGDRLSAAEHAALAAAGGLAQDTGLRSILNVTGAYTTTSADDVILANGTFTVSLLTAVGNTGKDFTVKNIGAGTITVDPAGSETIDGSATVSLAANKAVTVVSNGTSWSAIGGY